MSVKRWLKIVGGVMSVGGGPRDHSRCHVVLCAGGAAHRCRQSTVVGEHRLSARLRRGTREEWRRVAAAGAGGAEQEQQGRRCERQSGAHAGQCLHGLTARRPWQSACLAVAVRAVAAAAWAASTAAATVAAKAPQAPPRGSTQTSKHLTSVGQPAALWRWSKPRFWRDAFKLH